MKSKKTDKNFGLVWINDELRLHDNPLIARAVEECDRIIFCYFVDPALLAPNQYDCQRLGEHRKQFLSESLIEFNNSLSKQGQILNIFCADPVRSIEAICNSLPVNRVYRSSPVAIYELNQWTNLKDRFAAGDQDIQFHDIETRCIFERTDLSEIMNDFPKTFSRFRRKVEKIVCPSPLSSTEAVYAVLNPPEPVSLSAFNFETLSLEQWITNESPYARGGEHAALTQLSTYFSSQHPNQYKTTRNALDDWSSSSKWSLWLANGTLSVRSVVKALLAYQETYGKNEENNWLMFELLWREYFQWYAREYEQRLFFFRGIENKKTLGTFYPQRFKQWCAGNTPYPIVNACMRQLNETGYMSNRGRQIVASALIHELGMDWRCGASYFEQQLIDYDPASNWGNWQYIAGVGADPRGGRHFNLEKQTNIYDPEGVFIKRWADDTSYPKDFVDAADWPIA